MLLFLTVSKIVSIIILINSRSIFYLLDDYFFIFTLLTGTVSLKHIHDDFITHDAKSYKCDKEQTLNLTALNGTTVGHAFVSHIQMQAFANNDKHNFDEGKHS